MEDRYRRGTALLNIDDPRITQLVDQQGWCRLPEEDRIGAVYNFVRDRIPFGYNTSDDLAASTVLADGYGQCNTKTTLLMALLRAIGIGCRLHGATIDKSLQHGVMVAPMYWFAPRSIIHTWAEVNVGDRWVGLEGVIVDGGFSRGTDILKGIALGADLVVIGRLYLYGLAADGAPGIVRLLEILEDEVTVALGLCGAPSFAALNRSFLHPATPTTHPDVHSAFPLLRLGEGY
jgi:hypothetical protein